MPGTLITRIEEYLRYPWVKRVFFFAAFVAPVIHWFIALYVRNPKYIDFDVQREVGRRFLAGEYLYSDNFCYPYMPIAAMYFSPLALFDRTTAFTLRFTVAVACTWLTFFLLQRLTQGQQQEWKAAGFATSVVTLALAFPFILKDLDDGGPHLVLLALITGGFYFISKRYEKVGVTCLGLVIAVKVTAALFFPFLLLKRQWRLVGLLGIATAFWIILPMAWMGPASWWQQEREWLRVAGGAFVGQPIPFVEQDHARIQNQALKPALSRYLVTLQNTDLQRTTDPGYVPVLNLTPSVAKAVTLGATLVLLGWCGWYWQRPYVPPGDFAWLRESSALLILALLLSPSTWMQHLVWMVPGLYVIVVESHRGRGLDRSAAWLMVVYVMLALAFNREVLGKHRYDLLFSWHPYTFAMLVVLATLLICSRNTSSDQAVSVTTTCRTPA
jgi:alpha-1,2-mannosyltransferase